MGGLEYKDWDGVVKECDGQFKQMEIARHNMELAEVVQTEIKEFALEQRDKCVQPEPVIMEDEKKQDETPEKEEDSKE